MQVSDLTASLAAPRGSTAVTAPQERRDVEKVETRSEDVEQARKAAETARADRAEATVAADRERGQNVDVSA